jgi:hypothetical protein
MTSDEIIELAIQNHKNTRDAIRWAINQEREMCALLCEEEKINAVHYSAPTQSNWLAIKIRNKQ